MILHRPSFRSEQLPVLAPGAEPLLSSRQSVVVPCQAPNHAGSHSCAATHLYSRSPPIAAIEPPSDSHSLLASWNVFRADVNTYTKFRPGGVVITVWIWPLVGHTTDGGMPPKFPEMVDVGCGVDDVEVELDDDEVVVTATVWLFGVTVAVIVPVVHTVEVVDGKTTVTEVPATLAEASVLVLLVLVLLLLAVLVDTVTDCVLVTVCVGE